MPTDTGAFQRRKYQLTRVWNYFLIKFIRTGLFPPLCVQLIWDPWLHIISTLKWKYLWFPHVFPLIWHLSVTGPSCWFWNTSCVCLSFHPSSKLLAMQCVCHGPSSVFKTRSRKRETIWTGSHCSSDHTGCSQNSSPNHNTHPGGKWRQRLWERFSLYLQ